ncbi:GNAT family N-acetyltransferase [Paenibacillus montanisoli]|uniref:GNAT family N-acetyltransferase n=1 Tax=Paenibacillus montanisoli TaxID=2081970 RepID=A0A328U2I2_9BACL|nr:GNAT family N-acetyltransferase [Paenibacillus montanisoli]RAP74126.1 GNAT family N-acetyltransferase [Paenibacillus montanisoli]
MVHLVKPSVGLRESYMAFYREWVESREDIVPWIVGQDPSDFEDYVRFTNEADKEENIQEGFVAHSTYWLQDEEGRIVGATNIRHRLNQKLLESGGHIGYGIIPSQRRRGYATKLLELALLKTDELGIERALLVCDESNAASERTILRNGGQFESTFTEGSGNVVKRFWIHRNL